MTGLLRLLRSAVLRCLRPRSPLWPGVERAHRAREPLCQWCGTNINCQVHHIIPYHIDPSKELDPGNLITLCMSEAKCHFAKGHCGTSWLDWDADIRQKCEDRRHAVKFDAERDHSYGIVLDVFGRVIPKPIRGDTQTGWVEYAVLDEYGSIQADLEKGCIITRVGKFAPPLTIEPIPNGWHREDDPRPDAKEIPMI